ncbi:YbhB/YbcL family Raf kinase inhibitor-like protein [Caviibacterium pharyngocola]|uniref:YbhB/YbcL family Raf kinase inhibitor-like protein n=1 Tax=Caviibacterium pharyngocola TaxID=28159 RepID=A0A2M8RUQ0_9PAST|nr:YbhB/YbcL family Raf kinase inhibitor-like protein [Caviibacterium pharyngocola]PJG82632.1 YbhB/YbcL family Raf kinase inhibitor-like protein [Caviibacterium pharyngocola]
MKNVFLPLVVTMAAIASVQAKDFTLNVENLDNGTFHQKHLLSANYGFGCDGENLSPAISWKNPPKGTKNYVLTVFDKDAPTGLGWMHWVIINIPKEFSCCK